ncbi:precorrin-3B C(17)-methyltransferase [Anaerovorax odorimutans]|uniref:Precorrin-3B C(17)-methyltransferase n=1 Tax=Anaerovorax odorimutans TaxID=109327 RepID=A0ABT1RMF8_9FIRM|nr:precorrin-3B C(17)-methyltransferase [Anaerovorax odorimutans]MCQ4636376.1 precorrin-3B C(17)-methyltransferase [Anaerovorax odorimutans]
MKLYVVGLGPGELPQATGRAMSVLEECEAIFGYTVYIDLIKERFAHKRLISTSMKQEVQRCRLAIEETLKGRNVAMVCSGDSGVYGMAGLIYEIAQEYDAIEIEVVPGITAACSGAAVLGAPLIHDFAVISLSDLLTPWEQIEKRLECAAAADFVICLYNPSSKKRYDYLQKACDLILKYKDGSTVCGIAKNIGRQGESGRVLSLAELRNTQTDMFSTVYIGNSTTREIGGKMVTSRGYRIGGKHE